jgi:hypothetical protein
VNNNPSATSQARNARPARHALHFSSVAAARSHYRKRRKRAQLTQRSTELLKRKRRTRRHSCRVTLPAIVGLHRPRITCRSSNASVHSKCNTDLWGATPCTRSTNLTLRPSPIRQVSRRLEAPPVGRRCSQAAQRDTQTRQRDAKTSLCGDMASC